jgi:hypothetical protein
VDCITRKLCLLISKWVGHWEVSAADGAEAVAVALHDRLYLSRCSVILVPFCPDPGPEVCAWLLVSVSLSISHLFP